MNSKTLLLIASLSGALAVGLGAFGAHGLEPMLRETGRLGTFETAVKYHFYHTLLLFLLGILTMKMSNSQLRLAGWFVLAGMLIFSGTLYILCLTGITWLGAITPVGGVCLIIGWILTGIGAIKK